MKKHTEKPPIDELFARKLGNASLTPGPDSFARPQARMGQHKPESRVVFWRNPEIQRYMAAAACLLLVCLVGWRYRPSGEPTEQNNQLATHQSVKSVQEEAVRKEITRPQNGKTKSVTHEEEVMPMSNTSQMVVADNTGKISRDSNHKVDHTTGQPNLAQSGQAGSVAPVLAQEKPTESKSKVDAASPTFAAPAIPAATEQVADAKPAAKPNSVPERVLVVTIAEPEALVAARQAAKAAVEERAVLAQNERAAKDAKTDGLWQKVKRIKQGDVFARQDNTGNEESGLLGRAYSGLKHSLEKDKPSKQ